MHYISRVKVSKRALGVSFCLILTALVGGILFFATGANAAWLGVGSQLRPLLIENVDQLAEVRDEINAGTLAGKLGRAETDVWLKLTADIDLAEGATGNVADVDQYGTYQPTTAGTTDGGWTPIGNSAKPFKGHFDGGGHTISNIWIKQTGEYWALFGYGITGASISNLTLGPGKIEGSENYNAGIIGNSQGTGVSITNVINKADVKSGNQSAGGFIGFGSSNLKNVANYGNITASRLAGGISGYMGGGSIDSAYNFGSITATTTNPVGSTPDGQAGGMVGSYDTNYAAISITNVYNYGDITAYGRVGGIVGSVGTGGGKSYLIDHAYNYGTVTATYIGNAYVGGIMGIVDDVLGGAMNYTISNSVSMGQVIGGTSEYGRIIGHPSATTTTLTNNFAYIGLNSDFTDVDCTLPSLGLSSAGRFSSSATLTGKNGLDVTATQLNSGAAFWGAAAGVGPTFANGTLDPWDLAPGKLPVLKGLPVAGVGGVPADADGVQTGEIPAWINSDVSPAGVPSGPVVNAGQDGSAGSPYEIRTAEQLACLATLTNASGTNGQITGKTFKLMEDIDLKAWATVDSLAAGVTSTNGSADVKHGSGKGWTPIGQGNMANSDQVTSPIPFSAIFDGNHKSIYNLYINGPNSDDKVRGLFGYALNAQIKDLSITSGLVTKNSSQYGVFGGVVGVANNSQISGVKNNASVKSGGARQNLAGIAGYILGNTQISGSSNSGYISTSASSAIAGLAAVALGTSKITTSFNSGAIYSSDGGSVLGGLVTSLAGDSAITDSYNTGAVTNSAGSDYTDMGGIVASIGDFPHGYPKIQRVYNSGIVSGKVTSLLNIGGIAGKIAGNGEISYSVTLSSSVTFSGTLTYINPGRIVGKVDSSIQDTSTTLENNFALETTNDGATTSCSAPTFGSSGSAFSSDLGHDQKNGADVSAADLATAAFWQGTGAFTGLNQSPKFNDSNSAWTLANSKFPILQGLPGQSDTIPSWALDGDEPEGTSGDPYLISTADQLACFATLVNDGDMFDDENIELTADIDLDAWNASVPETDTYHGGGKGWMPIGYSSVNLNSSGFQGNFNGKEHKISNLFINTSGYGGSGILSGLFGNVNYGIVKNLGIESGLISVSEATSKQVYIGSIVGYAYETSIINVYNKAKIGNLTDVVGGIAAGGIAGYIGQGSAISESRNFGELNLSYGTEYYYNYVGGIAGDISNSTVEKSYNAGPVNISPRGNYQNYIGAIAGNITNSTIEQSYNTEPLTVISDGNYASVYAAGIAAQVMDSSSLISRTYNTGDISATSNGDNLSVYAAGLVGLLDLNATLDSSFNSGAVRARAVGASTNFYNSKAGGLVGITRSYSIVTNSVQLGNVLDASSTSGSTIVSSGRITSDNETNTTLSNNYALTDIYTSTGCMLPSLGPGMGTWGNAHDGVDGKDVTAATLTDSGSKDWWKNTATGNNGPGFVEPADWTITGNRVLPTLNVAGMTGQDNTLPDWISSPPVIPAYPAGTAADGHDADHPHLISTPEQLACVATIVNSQAATGTGGMGSGKGFDGRFLKLAANIDLKDWATAQTVTDAQDGVNHPDLAGITEVGDAEHGGGEGWTPIGFHGSGSGPAFAGTFDGDGYEIKNLYMDKTNTTSTDFIDLGLFGFTDRATLKNFGVANGYLASKQSRVWAQTTGGGIVSISHESSISNIFNKANLYVKNNPEINNCSVILGGIVGKFSNSTATANVTNVYNTGNIIIDNQAQAYANSFAGGILGYITSNTSSTTVEYAYNTGDIQVFGVTVAAPTILAVAGGIVGSSTSDGHSYTIGRTVQLGKIVSVNGVDTDSGRILGNYSGENLFENFAWSDVTGGVDTDCSMPTLGPGISAGNWDSKLDGKDGDSQPSLTFTQEASVLNFWDTVFFESIAPENIRWTRTDRGLPTLKQSDGSAWKSPTSQSSALPTWITTPAPPTDPQGTSLADAIQISTPEQLGCLAQLTNAPATNDQIDGKFFKQVDDIDLSAWKKAAGAPGYTNDNNWGWMPIGINDANPFSGHYDGGSNKITNLNINRQSSTTQYFGLFGFGDDAQISDLNLSDGNISITSTSNQYAAAGSVLGGGNYLDLSNIQSNVGVSLKSSTATIYAGGIVASVGNSTLTNLSNNGVVSMDSAGANSSSEIYAIVGGVVGSLDNTTSSELSNTGDVSLVGDIRYHMAGGIAGRMMNESTLTDSTNSGSIYNKYDNSNDGSFTGGIVGTLYYDSNVSNSYNTGSVTGVSESTSYVGGISGYANNSQILYTFNSGIISMSSGGPEKYVGGISGFLVNSGLIEYSYNTGYVSSTDSLSAYAGGIAGGVSGSQLHYNVQLGETVASDQWSTARRIAGYAYYYTFTNNYAWEGVTDGDNTVCGGMTAGSTAFGTGTHTLEDTDGLDVSSAALTATASDWFGTHTLSSNPNWNTAGGFLPTLNKTTSGIVGVQDTALPHWITDPTATAGSATYPYEIANAEDLACLAKYTNGDGVSPVGTAGKYFKMTADVDLSGWNSNSGSLGGGNGWMPIGTGTAFQGNFDGAGHNVENLFIKRGSANQGLFGAVSGTAAVIKNVGVTSGSVTGSGNVGAIVGSTSGTVTISDVYNFASINAFATSTYNYGGLVGNASGVTISRSYNSGNVSFGFNYDNPNVGGIAGQLSGYVYNSYNTGNIIAGGGYVGGIAGKLTANSIISRTYNTGNVAYNANGSSQPVGGIASTNDNTPVQINNSAELGRDITYPTSTTMNWFGARIRALAQFALPSATNLDGLENNIAYDKITLNGSGLFPSWDGFTYSRPEFGIGHNRTGGESITAGDIWQATTWLGGNGDKSVNFSPTGAEVVRVANVDECFDPENIWGPGGNDGWIADGAIWCLADNKIPVLLGVPSPELQDPELKLPMTGFPPSAGLTVDGVNNVNSEQNPVSLGMSDGSVPKTTNLDSSPVETHIELVTSAAEYAAHEGWSIRDVQVVTADTDPEGVTFPSLSSALNASDTSVPLNVALTNIENRSDGKVHITIAANFRGTINLTLWNPNSGLTTSHILKIGPPKVTITYHYNLPEPIRSGGNPSFATDNSQANLPAVSSNQGVGDTFAVPSQIPTVEGYVFNKWTAAESSSTEYTGTLDAVAAGEEGVHFVTSYTLGLYAQWTPKPVTVTYATTAYDAVDASGSGADWEYNSIGTPTCSTVLQGNGIQDFGATFNQGQACPSGTLSVAGTKLGYGQGAWVFQGWAYHETGKISPIMVVDGSNTYHLLTKPKVTGFNSTSFTITVYPIFEYQPQIRFYPGVAANDGTLGTLINNYNAAAEYSNRNTSTDMFKRQAIPAAPTGYRFNGWKVVASGTDVTDAHWADKSIFPNSKTSDGTFNFWTQFTTDLHNTSKKLYNFDLVAQWTPLTVTSAIMEGTILTVDGSGFLGYNWIEGDSYGVDMNLVVHDNATGFYDCAVAFGTATSTRFSCDLGSSYTNLTSIDIKVGWIDANDGQVSGVHTFGTVSAPVSYDRTIFLVSGVDESSTANACATLTVGVAAGQLLPQISRLDGTVISGTTEADGLVISSNGSDCTRPGYHLKGWGSTPAPTASNAVTSPGSYTLTDGAALPSATDFPSNRRLYAIWQREIKLSYWDGWSTAAFKADASTIDPWGETSASSGTAAVDPADYGTGPTGTAGSWTGGTNNLKKTGCSTEDYLKSDCTVANSGAGFRVPTNIFGSTGAKYTAGYADILEGDTISIINSAQMINPSVAASRPGWRLKPVNSVLVAGTGDGVCGQSTTVCWDTGTTQPAPGNSAEIKLILQWEPIPYTVSIVDIRGKEQGADNVEPYLSNPSWPTNCSTINALLCHDVEHIYNSIPPTTTTFKSYYGISINFLADPTRDGNAFNGWSFDGGLYGFGDGLTSTLRVPASNVPMRDTWDAKEYNLIWDPNEAGSGSTVIAPTEGSADLTGVQEWYRDKAQHSAHPGQSIEFPIYPESDNGEKVVACWKSPISDSCMPTGYDPDDGGMPAPTSDTTVGLTYSARWVPVQSVIYNASPGLWLDSSAQPNNPGLTNGDADGNYNYVPTSSLGTYTIPTNVPIRKGFTFKGWKALSQDASLDGKIYINGGSGSGTCDAATPCPSFTMPTGWVSLQAIWEYNSIYVSYADPSETDIGAGVCTPIANASSSYTSFSGNKHAFEEYDVPPAPAGNCLGYVFTGWKRLVYDSNNNAFSGSSYTTALKNAIYSRSTTTQPTTGGSFPQYGDNTTASTTPGPFARDDYPFVVTGIEPSEHTFLYPVGPGSEVTFVPVYQKVTHTLTYYKSLGDEAVPDTCPGGVNGSTVETGDVVAVGSQTDCTPSRPGWTFKGWKMIDDDNKNVLDGSSSSFGDELLDDAGWSSKFESRWSGTYVDYYHAAGSAIADVDGGFQTDMLSNITIPSLDALAGYEFGEGTAFWLIPFWEPNQFHIQYDPQIPATASTKCNAKNGSDSLWTGGASACSGGSETIDPAKIIPDQVLSANDGSTIAGTYNQFQSTDPASNGTNQFPASRAAALTPATYTLPGYTLEGWSTCTYEQLQLSPQLDENAEPCQPIETGATAIRFERARISADVLDPGNYYTLRGYGLFQHGYRAPIDSSRNLKLYAVWTPNNFAISFEKTDLPTSPNVASASSIGGSVTTMQGIFDDPGDGATAVTLPSTGHTLAGWNLAGWTNCTQAQAALSVPVDQNGSSCRKYGTGGFDLIYGNGGEYSEFVTNDVVPGEAGGISSVKMYGIWKPKIVQVTQVVAPNATPVGEVTFDTTICNETTYDADVYAEFYTRCTPVAPDGWKFIGWSDSATVTAAGPFKNSGQINQANFSQIVATSASPALTLYAVFDLAAGNPVRYYDGWTCATTPPPTVANCDAQDLTIAASPSPYTLSRAGALQPGFGTEYVVTGETHQVNVNTPLRTGYIFQGYKLYKASPYTTAEGTWLQPGGTFTAGYENIYLVAQWTADTDTYHDILFSSVAGQGTLAGLDSGQASGIAVAGCGNEYEMDLTPAAQYEDGVGIHEKARAGVEINMPSTNCEPTKTGFDFLGWKITKANTAMVFDSSNHAFAYNPASGGALPQGYGREAAGQNPYNYTYTDLFRASNAARASFFVPADVASGTTIRIIPVYTPRVDLQLKTNRDTAGLNSYIASLPADPVAAPTGTDLNKTGIWFRDGTNWAGANDNAKTATKTVLPNKAIYRSGGYEVKGWSNCTWEDTENTGDAGDFETGNDVRGVDCKVYPLQSDFYITSDFKNPDPFPVDTANAGKIAKPVTLYAIWGQSSETPIVNNPEGDPTHIPPLLPLPPGTHCEIGYVAYNGKCYPEGTTEEEADDPTLDGVCTPDHGEKSKDECENGVPGGGTWTPNSPKSCEDTANGCVSADPDQPKPDTPIYIDPTGNPPQCLNPAYPVLDDGKCYPPGGGTGGLQPPGSYCPASHPVAFNGKCYEEGTTKEEVDDPDTDGTCSDPFYTTRTECEGAGEPEWVPTPPPGHCTSPTYTSEQACNDADEPTWTPNDPKQCELAAGGCKTGVEPEAPCDSGNGTVANYVCHPLPVPGGNPGGNPGGGSGGGGEGGDDDEPGGTCSVPGYYTLEDCEEPQPEGPGGTWTPNPDAPGSCDVPGFYTKAECEGTPPTGGGGTWTPGGGSCSVPGYYNERDCEEPPTSGTWTPGGGNCNLPGYSNPETCEGGGGT